MDKMELVMSKGGNGREKEGEVKEQNVRERRREIGSDFSFALFLDCCISVISAL